MNKCTIKVLFLLSIIFLSTAIISSYANANHRVRWVYDSSFGVAGNIDDVAVNDNGSRIYVLDSSDSRVRKYTNNGRFMRSWDLPEGIITYYSSITVDKFGNLYAVDAGRNFIYRISGDNVQLWKRGIGNEDDDFVHVTDITYTPNRDSFYLVDLGDNTRIIRVWREDREVKNIWGRDGNRNGQFNNPHGVAADPFNDSVVYVADTGNNRIQQFNFDGGFVRKWGARGQQFGQFDVPEELAVDGFGDVLVTDKENHRVQRFAYPGSGGINQEIGELGAGFNQFDRPAAIALGWHDTHAFVADTGNGRIVKLTQILP